MSESREGSWMNSWARVSLPFRPWHKETTSKSFILENSCSCFRSPPLEPLAVARALLYFQPLCSACYPKTEFASWWVLNQKTQPSQRSGEGSIYYYFNFPFLFLCIYILIFIYLFIFGCAEWHTVSEFPSWGSNLRLLHWELEILITELPEKSQEGFMIICSK